MMWFKIIIKCVKRTWNIPSLLIDQKSEDYNLNQWEKIKQMGLLVLIKEFK